MSSDDDSESTAASASSSDSDSLDDSLSSVPSASSGEVSPGEELFDAVSEDLRSDSKVPDAVLQVVAEHGEAIDANWVDKTGDTALSWAAFGGAPQIVRALLRLPGIQVDFESRGGMTALMCACFDGDPETVRILLEHGASPRKRNAFGHTAASYAAMHNKHAAIEVLLQWSVLPDFSFEPRAVAAQRNTNLLALPTRETRQLIDDGLAVWGDELPYIPSKRDLDLNPSKNPGSAFRRACAKGSVTKAKRLLAQIEDPNERNRIGLTGFHLACWYGRCRLLDLLLSDPRIDPSILDPAGRTGYYIAAAMNHTGAIRVLNAHQPRVDITIACNGIPPEQAHIEELYRAAATKGGKYVKMGLEERPRMIKYAEDKAKEEAKARERAARALEREQRRIEAILARSGDESGDADDDKEEDVGIGRKRREKSRSAGASSLKRARSGTETDNGTPEFESVQGRSARDSPLEPRALGAKQDSKMSNDVKLEHSEDLQSALQNALAERDAALAKSHELETQISHIKRDLKEARQRIAELERECGKR